MNESLDMLISRGETYLLIIHSKYKREVFLKSFNVVSGSWGEHFANRLFNCLFGNTTNLTDEYKSFYTDEYPDFTTFLAKSYCFDNKVISKIKKYMKRDYIILYGEYGSEGDYNTSQLIQYNDEILDSINKVFNKGVKNENENGLCYQ